MSVADTTTVRKPEPQSRRNVWLAVLAIVQAAVLAFVLLTVARPPRTQTGPLLGQGVQTSDITAFTVTGADGASVAVKRDGTQWVLPDQDGYPAQASRVTSFLQQLVGLQRSGLVATTKDAYKRLKVSSDSFQRKIALTLKGGESETLYIGSEPSYGSTHVRLASDKGVYVTHSLHASDARTDAAGYVDPTALKLNASDVTRLEVKNANGDFVFTRGGSGWSMQGVPGGETFDPSTVTNVVSSLTDLQLDEPLGKTVKAAYGFDNPLAVVTLTTVSKAASSGSGSSGSGSNGSASSTGASSSGAASGGSGSNGSGSNGSGSNGSGSNGSGSSASPSAAASSAASAGSAASSGAASSGSGANASQAGAAGSGSSGAAPAKTVTKTTTITVGAKDKDGFYPVRISGSPYIVRASDSNLGSVIEKKASDFFAKPKGGAGSAGAGPGGPAGNAGGATAVPGSGGPASGQ